ncbi:Proto-chlorophyllide reductase 57 kD subunit [Synechococcus sp. PCC 7502]|uniref:PCP reductase family protein n=1 Tax=Synechococcus sp. PCC 7502 TaxID=1173263 RepID=UPI00029FA612|nr:PCP reductase family protein [Synechococcus sp. PCC 7502]AFY73993.1 Proto-chlorophyllide reductase 57 kD subunit [Synechococcus sp. PCC 7502]
MSEAVTWSTEAEAKLQEVPFWGRFLVRREVEKFARGLNKNEVSIDVYNLANQKWQREKPKD